MSYANSGKSSKNMLIFILSLGSKNWRCDLFRAIYNTLRSDHVEETWALQHESAQHQLHKGQNYA